MNNELSFTIDWNSTPIKVSCIYNNESEDLFYPIGTTYEQIMNDVREKYKIPKKWLIQCDSCQEFYISESYNEPSLCPLEHAQIVVQDFTSVSPITERKSQSGTIWRIFINDDGSLLTAKVVE